MIFEKAREEFDRETDIVWLVRHIRFFKSALRKLLPSHELEKIINKDKRRVINLESDLDAPNSGYDLGSGLARSRGPFESHI